MSSESAEKQEMKEENDELQDEEQFEKSEEFENQGFEYGAPLDDNPEHKYSEGHPEGEAEAESEALEEPENYKMSKDREAARKRQTTQNI